MWQCRFNRLAHWVCRTYIPKATLIYLTPLLISEVERNVVGGGGTQGRGGQGVARGDTGAQGRDAAPGGSSDPKGDALLPALTHPPMVLSPLLSADSRRGTRPRTRSRSPGDQEGLRSFSDSSRAR